MKYKKYKDLLIVYRLIKAAWYKMNIGIGIYAIDLDCTII